MDGVGAEYMMINCRKVQFSNGIDFIQIRQYSYGIVKYISFWIYIYMFH